MERAATLTCLVAPALPVNAELATAAAVAQITVAHVMLRSVFVFNGLMLSFSGMAAHVTPVD